MKRYNYSPYVRLATAVLWRALTDYHAWRADHTSHNINVSASDGRSARLWFLGGSPLGGGLRFDLVAEVLGYEPRWLAERCMHPDVGQIVLRSHRRSKDNLRKLHDVLAA